MCLNFIVCYYIIRYRKVLGILQKDGTFAQYITLPVENLYVVPDQVSTLQAAFTGTVKRSLFWLVKPLYKVNILCNSLDSMLILPLFCKAPCL